ncbi:transcription factor Adf-1-like [Cataglyphis hispanica]|uniref:transcription factor Adf-1-like n=1 Tax=Cataglyphis hispanica TaxID=1086592 RepID=UPI00217FAF0B|nr:transcription factor Adf-1-like [Cataglyphis hispanica]
MDHDSYHYASSYQDEDEDFDYGNKNEMSGDALLISLVRDYPYLYNKELTDFKDSLKKQNAWVEIASVMDMTVEDCQSRWMRLRERYSREKKQQEETTTGSGASKRKTFEFFDNMQFLKRFVKRRKTMTNIYKMKNKSVSPVIGSSNLQKNFDSHDEKGNNSSSQNVATLNKPLIKSIVDLTSDSAQHIGSVKVVMFFKFICTYRGIHRIMLKFFLFLMTL